MISVTTFPHPAGRRRKRSIRQVSVIVVTAQGKVTNTFSLAGPENDDAPGEPIKEEAD